MNRVRYALLVILIAVFVHSCSSLSSTESRLREWQRGVWVSGGGAYTIWTDTHYFVVSVAGDSVSANIYCGSSQVRFTDKGVARRQNVRVRQLPGKALKNFSDFSMYTEGDGGGVEEAQLEIDINKFEAGTCNIVEGVIYDSVTEETSEYIILSTCNGDRVKLFSDGRSLYMPAGGGEHWSYRLESW